MTTFATLAWLILFAVGLFAIIMIGKSFLDWLFCDENEFYKRQYKNRKR